MSREVLHSIREGQPNLREIPSVKIGEVKLNYTYCDRPPIRSKSTGHNDSIIYVDSVDRDVFNAGKKIFDPDTMPKSWKKFLEQAWELRVSRGTTYPIELLECIDDLSRSSSLALSLEIKAFKRLSNSKIDTRNVEEITNTIHKVINNHKLRGELLKIASVAEPESANIRRLPQGSKMLPEMVKKLKINNGLAVDLGCGNGEKTATFAGDTKLFVVGVDRQYDPMRSGRAWGLKRRNLQFVMADTGEGVPIAENSADLVVMHMVAHTMTDNALERTVEEALRILKPNGVFVIFPQETKDKSGWKIFRKEKKEDGQDYLTEHTLDQLISTKPESLRLKHIISTLLDILRR